MLAADNAIRPFQIGFPEAELTELHRRVNLRSRPPERRRLPHRGYAFTMSIRHQSARPLWWYARLTVQAGSVA